MVPIDQLFDLTQIFLVVNGLMFTAIGAADHKNHKLKTGLSIVGLFVSVIWQWSNCLLENPCGNTYPYDWLLRYILPTGFIVGWVISLVIHVTNFGEGA